jgi:hypothetical protein
VPDTAFQGTGSYRALIASSGGPPGSPTRPMVARRMAERSAAEGCTKRGEEEVKKAWGNPDDSERRV